MPSPAGYTIRFPKVDGPAGQHGAVAFMEKHWKLFQKETAIETRAQMHATMRAWCERGPKDLPRTKFKFQETYERNGRNVRVEAFKGWQVRLYGAVTQIDGKPMFLVTGVDISKKTDKADKERLKAAGKAAHQLIHGE